MSGTVVLGLGNLVHTDDGAGIHAIHALQQDKRVPANVTLIDGGTHGLSLLAHICGAERLLVLDAVDAAAAPGTLLRFEGRSLRGMPGKPSVHQLGFADLMVALELIGEPAGEMVLLGIQPQSTEWGAVLSEPVEKALPGLVECVIDQLQVWH